MGETLSKAEVKDDFNARIVRALAKSALQGSEGALLVLRESREELVKWVWIPEVRKLFEKGLI